MVFDAETKLPGDDLAAYRPALVAVSGDLAYCSLFKDDAVGPWVLRNGMTGTEYQAELDHSLLHPTTNHATDARFVLTPPADETNHILGDDQEHSGQPAACERDSSVVD
jgi:hypothetical protein